MGTLWGYRHSGFNGRMTLNIWIDYSEYQHLNYLYVPQCIELNIEILFGGLNIGPIVFQYK